MSFFVVVSPMEVNGHQNCFKSFVFPWRKIQVWNNMMVCLMTIFW